MDPGGCTAPEVTPSVSDLGRRMRVGVDDTKTSLSGVVGEGGVVTSGGGARRAAAATATADASDGTRAVSAGWSAGVGGVGAVVMTMVSFRPGFSLSFSRRWRSSASTSMSCAREEEEGVLGMQGTRRRMRFARKEGRDVGEWTLALPLEVWGTGYCCCRGVVEVLVEAPSDVEDLLALRRGWVWVVAVDSEPLSSGFSLSLSSTEASGDAVGTSPEGWSAASEVTRSGSAGECTGSLVESAASTGGPVFLCGGRSRALLGGVCSWRGSGGEESTTTVGVSEEGGRGGMIF